ncbi:MAG: T9SS type A sorting domain-containing protein, partial [Bacteroidales bacterium]|nr:T9SS type A sorting domain-containing protein [Bacteroidales bacterium]
GEVRIASPEAINLVQFYNMQGVLMQSLAPASETATFDVNGYPNGIYVVAVQSNGKIATKKIMK